MDKQQAEKLLKQEVTTENLQKHSFAVAVAMRALASHFDKDQGKKLNNTSRPPQAAWEICGLLHDIDYEQTKEEPKKHSKIGKEMLKEKGLSEKICEAVYTHNDAHGVEPQTLMGKALYCVDPLTGLIVAATLVLPSKKIKDLEVENVLNRFKEKRFAEGADREVIAKCEDYLDLELKEFIEIVLKAMQRISEKLDL